MLMDERECRTRASRKQNHYFPRMRSGLGWGESQAYGSWNPWVPWRECGAGQLGRVQPKDLRRPPREPDQLGERSP